MRDNLGDRRQLPRSEAQLEVRLSFSARLLDARAQEGGLKHMRALGGTTRNISETGLSLVLPAKNLDERYLTGDMQLVLELPTGSIQVNASLVWWEQINKDEVRIGVRITGISEGDRALYEAYLSTPGLNGKEE